MASSAISSHVLSSCMTCTAASCEGLHPALATAGRSQKRVHLWPTIGDLALTYYMHRPRQADTTRPTQRAAAAILLSSCSETLLAHGMHMAAPLRRPAGVCARPPLMALGPCRVYISPAAALFKLACILHDCIDDHAISRQTLDVQYYKRSDFCN